MTSTTFDMSSLEQWVGKTESSCQVVHATAATALAATLDRDLPLPPGAVLPPLWHWIYFWSVCSQSEIGSDGHPQRGEFMPPVPLPRRMWAGGRLKFYAPLTIDAIATRASRVMRVTAKKGKSGDLAFVTVKHQITCGDVIAVSEENDIVYRGLPQPGIETPPQKAVPIDAKWIRTITPDPVLLFRYSALTFNGHRIHYDRRYATEVEGYPGLIVHGPLIAVLLVDLLHRYMPQARLSEFNFRAVSPLFDIEPFAVCGQPDADGCTIRLWAQNMRGELAMEAQATLTGE